MAVAADDPIVGVWNLNLAKSRYSPGPTPQRQTMKFEPAGGDALKLTSDTVFPDGRATHAGYTARFDGKENLVHDNPDADTSAMRRINTYTTETTWKKDGKVTITSRRSVSKDGKTLTITQKGTNGRGQPLDNVTVWDRQ